MSKKDKYFHEIDVNAFIEKIELSKKKRPQYYKGKVKIPKKYKTDDYEFDKNGILINLTTSEKVVKNTRSVGLPNVKTITGQYFWNRGYI